MNVANILQLDGRTAIVTGASRSSGRATALALARHGAAVVVTARTATDEIEAVAGQIRSDGGRALALLVNVADESSVNAMADRAIAEFGGIDILVNNAAIRPHCELTAMSYVAWREVLSVNLDGAFLCARACLPSMIERGGGVIINIGGATGHSGASQRAHVVTSKAALVGLTKAIAVEYGPCNVRANCVVPGRIAGRRSTTAGHRVSTNLPSEAPLRRDADPEDIAEMTLALILPSGRQVTGQTIHVNGGIYLP